MSSCNHPSELNMWLGFWERRHEIIASPRLGATTAGYIADPHNGGRYLSLAELLLRWQQGDLIQPCPTCSGDAFVRDYASLPWTSVWVGLCTHCSALVTAQSWPLSNLYRDKGAPRPEDYPEASGEITLEQAWLVLNGVEVRNKVLGPRGTVVAQYDPLERVLEDVKGIPLGEWDGARFRTTDNAVVAERTGNTLRLVNADGDLRDAFELDTVSDIPCYLKTGKTYLPIRYREQSAALVNADGSNCLSMEGFIPHDLLVAMAEGAIPGADIDGG